MKRQVAVAIGLLAFILLASCVTQPKKKPQPSATPEPTATPAPTPAVSAAPAELRATAEGLRKQCVDFGLNESMRDDYLKAEGSYAAGIENYEKDNALSASSLQAAIDGYKDILSRGLASLADEEKAKADEMRAAAIDKNAESASSDQMASGDAYVAAGGAKQAAADLPGAIGDYRSAVLSFEIAYERSRAIDAREKIDSNDWSGYDSGNYQLAGEQLAECDGAFESDPADSLDSAQEALLRYNLVLKKGWEYTLGEGRSRSDSEREKADGIKSERAAADEYAEAASAYENAAALEASEQFEEAAAAYESSADLFTLAYETAKGKMDKADGALDSLKAKREESKRKAEEGDAALRSAADGKGGAR